MRMIDTAFIAFVNAVVFSDTPCCRAISILSVLNMHVWCLLDRWFFKCDFLHAAQMRCRSSSGMAKIRNTKKYEYLIPFMSEQRVVALQIFFFFPFFSTPWSDSCCCTASAEESRHGLQSRQFVFLLRACPSVNRCRSYLDANNNGGRWLPKKKENIQATVLAWGFAIGTLFKPLFFMIFCIHLDLLFLCVCFFPVGEV